MAQLAAHRSYEPEVAGSSPVWSTSVITIYNASMAQLAERSAVNRQVPGSIPGGGASGSMAEWSKATDLSSVLHSKAWVQIPLEP